MLNKECLVDACTLYRLCIAGRICGVPMVCSYSAPLWYFIDLSALRTNLAAEFDPDRFIDERVSKYLTPNPFIFLPFNAGPRICLGQQVRCTLISLLLSSHMHHWRSSRTMKCPS